MCVRYSNALCCRVVASFVPLCLVYCVSVRDDEPLGVQLLVELDVRGVSERYEMLF